MKISWFIPEEDHYIRVEEELVNLGENQLTFSQKGKNYMLKSAYNLKEMLVDDILYAFQHEDRLFPIRGSPIFNPETLLRKFIDIEPEKLKEILELTTIDLKKEIDKLKKLIQFEIKKNAEDDIKKMDFLQNVDSYRDILYKKFLDFFKEKSDSIEKLVESNNKSVSAKPELEKIELKEARNVESKKMQEELISSAPASDINAKTQPNGEIQKKDREKVRLVYPNKKKAIQSLFKE